MICCYYLLAIQAFSAEKCTYSSNMFSIEDNTSLLEIKDDFRPTFLRLTSPGCPYTPLSDQQWKKAAQLFPQVNFVTVNCWQNSAICSQFGNSIMTPVHGLVPAGSSQVNEDTIIGNSEGLQSSPQLFIDCIQNNAKIYPISSPLYILSPMVTDSFYQNVENPIIVLYDSRCSEQVSFLNAWTQAANEELYPEGDNPRIGLLDCSKYESECLRWSRPYHIITPRALIYSTKTGNFEVLDSYTTLTKSKIDTLVSNADFMPNRPHPTPVPNKPRNITEPSTEGYAILENTDLQSRSLSTVKKQYSAFKAPSNGCKTGTECETRTNVEKCFLIEPSTDDHNQTVGILNFFRKHAGITTEVTEDSDWSDKAYSTAVNMHQIGRVPSDHNINPNYANEEYCGKEENIQVAKDSLLSENSKSAFHSMVKLFQDEGAHNNGVVGHRRWLLHPNLNKIGIGFYPYKEVKWSDGTYKMRPAVVVHKIIDKNSPSYIQNSVPENLNFISWPPAGPFPIQNLPSNWHICHPSFETATLDDLKVVVKRDDGLELAVQKLYLSNTKYIDNSLIIQMTSEALERCQIMRTITVSVFNTKTKQVFRFSFELFDDNTLTEACLYSTNSSLCPSTVADENKFSSVTINSATILNSKNPVKVYVVEPIILTQKLVVSTIGRIFFTGNSIEGTIEVQKNSVVDMQDPTKTDFTLHWAVSSRNIGKIDTSKQAKSILIQLSDESDKVKLYDIEFYTGMQTSCELSSPVYKGNDKYVYYTIAGSDDHFTVSAAPAEAYEIYSAVFDTEINSNPRVIQINSINDLKNQTTFKRAIKVYFNMNEGNNEEITIDSFIPGQKRDYQFINLGNKVALKCDLNIEKIASRVTFSQRDNNVYNFLVIASDPLDPRYSCSLSNIYIKGMKYNAGASKSTVLLPYVLGDDVAISFFKNDNFQDSYPSDADKGKNTINVGKKELDSPIQKALIVTDGKHDHYTIKIDMSTVGPYKVLEFKPEPGTESKPITISFHDSALDQDYPLTPNDCPSYFYNYENLSLDLLLFGYKNNNLPNLAPLYRFENYGKVRFTRAPIESISTSKITPLPYPDVDYGFNIPLKTDTIPATGSVSLTNAVISEDIDFTEKSDITLENSEIKKVSFNIGSSTTTLNKCKVEDDIKINIIKVNEGWPRLALVETPIKPEKIIIDLGISSSARLLADDEYEKHSVITGISGGSSSCSDILQVTELRNAGSFTKKCSNDNTEIYVVKGEKNAPILEPIPDNEEGDYDPDNQPAGGETQPTGDASQPAGGETQPTGDASQPAGGETQPTGDASQPAGGETQPTGDASQPAGGETQPTGDASQPAGGETQPTGDASQPAGGETQPTSDEIEEPVVTPMPVPTKPPELIKPLEDVSNDMPSEKLDEKIKDLLTDMEDENKEGNNVVSIDVDKVNFNTTLNDTQFILPKKDSTVNFDGGNLNLVIPEKVTVVLSDAQNSNLLIKGQGSVSLDFKESEKQPDEINLKSKSQINGTVEITVPKNVKSLVMESIDLDSSSQISVRKDQSDGEDQNPVKFTIIEVSTQPETEAKLSDVTIEKTLNIAQRAVLDLNNVDFNSASVSYSIDQFDTLKKPFIKGKFKSLPYSLKFNKISGEGNKPSENVEYPIVSGTFEDIKCEDWYPKVDLGTTGFNTKVCKGIAKSIKILASEDKSLVLKYDPNNKGDDSGDKNKLSAGAIAGIVIAVVVVIAIVVVVVIIVMKRKKNLDNSSDNENAGNTGKDEV